MDLFKKQQHITNGMLSAERKEIKGKFERHGHEFFEIEYIISGSGIYSVDGTEYHIEKNMLFFMSLVSFHELETDGAEIINVMFPCSMCDDEILFGLFAPENPSAVRFDEEDSAFAHRLLSEVVAAVEKGNYIYAVEFLRCLLYKLAELAPNASKQPASHIKSAIIYALGNFRSGVTLADTAKQLGLAPAYLSVLFRQEMGVNFKSYVDNLKFEYAVKLLEFTGMTVSEICSRSGFYDYANFIRRFKIRYGKAPDTYRKELNKKMLSRK